MRTPRAGPTAAVLALGVLVACGSETAAGPPAVSATTVAGAAARAPAPPSTTAVLGPEWRQRDGRVQIEATASGDPQILLRDLQALGLTGGLGVDRLAGGAGTDTCAAGGQTGDSAVECP